jgi:hypothetical protein
MLRQAHSHWFAEEYISWRFSLFDFAHPSLISCLLGPDTVPILERLQLVIFQFPSYTYYQKLFQWKYIRLCSSATMMMQLTTCGQLLHKFHTCRHGAVSWNVINYVKIFFELRLMSGRLTCEIMIKNHIQPTAVSVNIPCKTSSKYIQNSDLSDKIYHGASLHYSSFAYYERSIRNTLVSLHTNTS